MSNRTYICIECRTARRAQANGGLNNPLRCAICAGPLWELSHKFRIPEKSNVKGWNALLANVKADKLPRALWVESKGTALLEKIDWHIENVLKQKETERRRKLLKKLQTEREDVVTRYFHDKPAMKTHLKDSK